MSETPNLPVVAGCVAIHAVGPRKGTMCGAPPVSATYPFCAQHMHAIERPLKKRTRYKGSLPPELQVSFDEHMADTDPKNLVPEMANIRTLISHLLEQGHAIDENGNLAISKKDLEFIFAGTKLIGELSERQSKISPEKYVPVADVLKIITDIVNIVRLNLPKEMTEVKAQIAADIQRYCDNQIVGEGTVEEDEPDKS